MRHLTKERRAWIYGACLAAFPLLALYGLVEIEAAPVWGGFLLALLNLSPDDVKPVESPRDFFLEEN